MGHYSIKDVFGEQDDINFPRFSFAACSKRQFVPVTTFPSVISFPLGIKEIPGYIFVGCCPSMFIDVFIHPNGILNPRLSKFETKNPELNAISLANCMICSPSRDLVYRILTSKNCCHVPKNVHQVKIIAI